MAESYLKTTDGTDGTAVQGSESAGMTPLATFCRIMMAQSPLPTAIVGGPDHVLQCVSPSFARLFAQEVSALCGQSLRVVLASIQNLDLLDTLDHAVHTGVAITVHEVLHMHPQHGPIAWSYTICPILDPHGRPSELFLEVQDTTAQLLATQMAEDMREINQQLVLTRLIEQSAAAELANELVFIQALTHSLSEGVYALDMVGQVSYVNPSAERMVGEAAAELLGRPAQAAIPMRGRSGAGADPAAPFWSVMRTGVPYRDDDALLNQRYGAPMPVTYTLAPIRSAGAIVGVVAVMHDVSALLRLHHLREEYLTLLSHDLRSPLTTILGAAGLLRRRLAQHDLPRESTYADTIIASSHRMDHMIQDVLDRSALEADTVITSPNPMDLVVVLRAVIALLPTATDRRRIQLETVERLLIDGVVQQIERVLINLLSNALKYSPPDRVVEVQVSHDDQQALIAIRDQGVGIDQEDLPRLFTKHYRARSAIGVQGTGLGLYSSQLIVAAHHGRIWADSALGEGSTFFVAFPLISTDNAAAPNSRSASDKQGWRDVSDEDQDP